MEGDAWIPRHSNYKVFSSRDLAHTCQKLERRRPPQDFILHRNPAGKPEFLKDAGSIKTTCLRVQVGVQAFSPYKGRYKHISLISHSTRTNCGLWSQDCASAHYLELETWFYKAQWLRFLPGHISEGFPNKACECFPEKITFDWG